MKNIVKFLSKSKLAVAMIVLLLIVQACCDLALPSYTSDLLNIGLEQGGLEDAVPETVRTESLELLKLFMTNADAAVVDAAYSAPEGGVRRLSKDAGREALNGILLAPESAATGTITREDVQGQLSGMTFQIEGLTDMYLRQIAVRYVAAEFQAQGADMDAIRTAYVPRGRRYAADDPHHGAGLRAHRLCRGPDLGRHRAGSPREAL